MQVNSIGSVDNTSFGLVFDPRMDITLKKTEDLLTVNQPKKATAWKNKLEKLKGMLPDDYIISCRDSHYTYKTDAHSPKLSSREDIASYLFNSEKNLPKQLHSDIYLGRQDDKTVPEGKLLASIIDDFMGNETLTSIINKIRRMKQSNSLPE